ncbi:MAG: dihydroorotase [Oligoflexia bacterium]|nr:dihydroorotase [Oligoflexia bacterium]
MSKLLIKNGLVIDPAASLEEPRDVLLNGALIEAVERPGAIPESAATEVLNASGMWITPGFIDLHVHLREPGFEWKETIESGSRAAALGGFTTVCCMPNTKPVNHNAEITRFILEQGRRAGACRVLPIGSVSVGLKGEEMSPLSELWAAGCVAFSDDGEPVWDSGLMRRALEWAKMLGARISCHEEDKKLSCGGCMNESALSYRMGLNGMPKVAEDVMVARDIELARATSSKVHICHLSSARSVELVRRAKHDGIDVSAEVTPHHLLLTEETVGDYDTNAKMSPPLREQEDVEALRAGIKDGTIDAIASDHAPHEQDSKLVEFSKASFGILGLQTNLPLTLELVRNGTISRMRAIELWTRGPAKAFGLERGTLRCGAPADLSIINPDYHWTLSKELIASKSFNTPFMGRALSGIAETVIVEGQVVVKAHKLSR